MAVTKIFDVELVGVTKTFGKVKAVDDMSLGIKPKEFMTLLGPSGCGKTTALRCIAGLEKHDKGDIFIKGQLVNDVPPYRRNIGLVFQDYAIFPHMTIFENLAFGLKIRKVDKEEINERAKKYLELVRLPGYEERYASQLSGGERQRIALARSLIIEPTLLLLDEPLSNLDLKLRVQMRVELATMQREVGITTLYVTHDQGEAMAMSDRIAVMDHGRIKQVGTPTEIYNFPQDKFVADFIGEANIFSGKILERNETEIKISTDSDLTLFALPAEEELKGSVYVSVRPEAIKLYKQRPPLKNAFGGSIEAIEYLGSYVKCHICLNNNQKVVAHILYTKQVPDYFSPGKKIYVGWEHEDCTLINR